MQDDALAVERREKWSRLQGWTRRKIRVHLKPHGPYFVEREIWWSSLGENVGAEANGKHDVFERPVIILRGLSRDLVFVVPVTTRKKTGSWFRRFDFRGGPRWAVLAQARTISAKRLVRRMGTLDPETFAGIKNAFIALINNGHPGQ